MSQLLEGKCALIMGGGQTPGETIGNGRATAVQFAREGAQVAVGDVKLDSAEATVEMIKSEGGVAFAHEVDVTDEQSVRAIVDTTIQRLGQLDILHNNVGASLALGDSAIEDISSEAFDGLVALNLRGMVFACKHVLPHMRERGRGVIINISSMAAWAAYPYVGYKTTKAGVIALTEQLAATNARYGIRANVILPGLMNTPMAIESRVSDALSREEVIAQRDKHAYHSVARWVLDGTSHMLRGFWRRIEPVLLPALACQSMVGRA